MTQSWRRLALHVKGTVVFCDAKPETDVVLCIGLVQILNKLSRAVLDGEP